MEDEFKTLVGTFPLNIFRAVKQRKKATDEIFLIIGNHLILICLDYHALLSVTINVYEPIGCVQRTCAYAQNIYNPFAEQKMLLSTLNSTCFLKSVDIFD